MITRVDVIQSVEKYDVETIHKLLDYIESCTDIEEYIIHYYNGTVLIYDTSTDLYLTWYKLTHIGRALTTNMDNIRTLNGFIDTLIDYVKENEQ